MIKGLLVTLLGLVALGIVLGATLKWYRKYKENKDTKDEGN